MYNTGSTAVSIDATPPLVTYAGNTGTYTVDQMISITCSASDALSGIATSTCTDIHGPAYNFVVTHTYSASATDLAGNTGTSSTIFTVIVTTSSLANVTNALVT